MRRRPDILSLALLLGLGAAYQLLFLREGIGLIDEGHLANAARRISGGEVLYRDVYSVYPPASFQFVSVLLDLFGTSLIVVRAFHVVMTLALGVTIFLAARDLMPTAWAWLAGMLVVATGWEAIVERCHYAYLYCVFPVAALLLFSRYAKGDLARRGLVAIGLLAGLTLTFRLVPFAALVLALAVGVVFRDGWTRRGVEAMLCLAGGALLVLVPTGLFFAFQGAAGDLLYSVFWTSVGQYVDGGEFNLPFPGLEVWPTEWSRGGLRRLFVSWEFHLPLLIYAAVVAEFVVMRVAAARGGEPVVVSAASLSRLTFAVFGAVLFLRATGRSDYYHLASVLAPAYLLGCDFLSRGWSRLARRFSALTVSGREAWLANALVALLMSASFWLHGVDGAARRIATREGDVALSAGGPQVRGAGFVDELVADVRSRISPGDPLVVLPWYPVLYFLSEGANPTRYDWIFPGYLERGGGVDRVIEAIGESEVEIVVYSRASIDGRRDRSLAGFAPELDRFLRKQFRPVARYGHFVVMQRVRP
jgi:hypothetical protein